jgi:hypothetical protein
MLRRALGDYGPDVILLPGPGSNLGGAVGQVLVSLGWAGLRDKDAFLERQRREPILISTRWPDQRALVVR